MNWKSDRVRLAITAFDEPERLASTLDRLLSQGLEAGQLCLIGAPDALELAASTSTDRTLATLCARTRETGIASVMGRGHLSATEGPVLELLLGDLARLGISSRESGEETAVIDDLSDDRDVLLVVQSNGARQQVSATRAMLAGSSRRVTTHEYARSAV